MSFYRKSYEVVGYTYDADIHCIECAVARFGADQRGEVHADDSEGNAVHPIFLDQVEDEETCGDCGAKID